MNDYLDQLAGEEDVELAQELDRAEDLERFFRLGGGGAALIAALRDEMVGAYLALPDAVGEQITDCKIRIAAYRLLIDKVKQTFDFLVEARHDIAESDGRFMRRLADGDDNTQEDA
jgi:hypothetical protein